MHLGYKTNAKIKRSKRGKANKRNANIKNTHTHTYITTNTYTDVYTSPNKEEDQEDIY